LTCIVFILAASATGCHTIQPSTPIAVNVRDAETHAPVASATVRMWRFGPHEKDRDASYITGADGISHAQLAPPDEGGVVVDVTAPNYLPTQLKNLPPDIVDALASAKAFRPYKGPPLSVTVDLFAGPRPTVELIIPQNYRGLVKVNVKVREDGQWPAGQRTLSCPVPADGVVRVEGPPVFGHGNGPEFVAKYADGTPLAKEGKDGDILLRWIRHADTETCFVIGTTSDEAAAHLALNDMDNTPREKPKSQAGNGGGRHGGSGGRGGRMGGR
jgi:hypothetical protein